MKKASYLLYLIFHNQKVYLKGESHIDFRTHYVKNSEEKSVIFALFPIAGIHSTRNLKTYEQANHFFNPANTQFSSKEALKKKRHTFTAMCSLFTQFNTKFMSQKTQAYSQPSQISKKRKQLMAKSQSLILQNAPSQMFDRFLNPPLDDTSRLDRSNKCAFVKTNCIYSFINNSKSKQN